MMTSSSVAMATPGSDSCSDCSANDAMPQPISAQTRPAVHANNNTSTSTNTNILAPPSSCPPLVPQVPWEVLTGAHRAPQGPSSAAVRSCQRVAGHWLTITLGLMALLVDAVRLVVVTFPAEVMGWAVDWVTVAVVTVYAADTFLRCTAFGVAAFMASRIQVILGTCAESLWIMPNTRLE